MLDNAAERTLRDLRRHREAIGSAIELAKDASNPDDGTKRSKQRVSFLVRYLRDNPLTRAGFDRLLRMRKDWLNTPDVQRQCRATEKAIVSWVAELRRLAAKGGTQLQTRFDDRIHDWTYEGLGGQMSAREALVRLSRRLSDHTWSTVPNGRISDYQNVALVLVGVSAVLNHLSVEVNVGYERLGIPTLERMLGFDLDYAGHTSASTLAEVYLEACPSEADALFPDKYDRMLYLDRPRARANRSTAESLSEIRLAAEDVCAIIERSVEGLQTRSRALDRVADYIQLFLRGYVKERSRRESRIEERVLQPKIEELLFQQGFYFMSQPQLLSGRRRPDLLVRVKDDWC
jgi:hypothetical protein